MGEQEGHGKKLMEEPSANIFDDLEIEQDMSLPFGDVNPVQESSDAQAKHQKPHSGSQSSKDVPSEADHHMSHNEEKIKKEESLPKKKYDPVRNDFKAEHKMSPSASRAEVKSSVSSNGDISNLGHSSNSEASSKSFDEELDEIVKNLNETQFGD